MAKHAENQGLKPPDDTSIVRDCWIDPIGIPAHGTLDVTVPVTITRRCHRTVFAHHGRQVATFHEPG